MLQLARFFARPLISLWLRFSTHSWERHVVATDSPHVHAPGTNPDRVLLTGDGAATGRGVRTHDLGLPGYLARALTARTTRATDVDIIVNGKMTAQTCREALEDVDLGRFDIIVLSVGSNEALTLQSVPAWRKALGALLADIAHRSPAATQTFVLAISPFAINPHFPGPLGRIVDRHVHSLNAETEVVLRQYPRMVFVPEHERPFELEGAHLYQQWAETLAFDIAQNLDPTRPNAGDTVQANEAKRQEALRHLETLTTEGDADLDKITAKARRLFGAPIAAVTLIKSDTQVLKSASGIQPTVLPRSESFCDTTIRRTGHLVIEDASLDSRYADYTVVTEPPHVRFYAGYPLEAPDGQRVGALCVMDTKPRHFTEQDATALRNLALTVQRHLYPETSLGTRT